MNDEIQRVGLSQFAGANGWGHLDIEINQKTGKVEFEVSAWNHQSGEHFVQKFDSYLEAKSKYDGFAH